jgi:PE-PGRS family protein with aspartyl peptidase-like domain
MAGRDGKKQARKARAGRRLLVGAGAGAGAFLAAAAMATGSAVTAAPAHADFEDLLDPIIQPLLSSFTDAVSAVDPAAALDITSWTDSLLSSLGSFDLALPSTDSALAAAATAAEPAASSTLPSTADLPITIQEATEPTVGATVDGAGTTLLVDTGSSGLVVPLTDLDGGSTNFLTELQSLESLGSPTSWGESGYSGGVEYLYLTYNEPVDYATTGGGTLDTTAPIEVEVYSWDPSNFGSLFTNDAFQNFLSSDDVTGILGIGDNASGSAGESPIEAAGYTGVTVDLPNHELILQDTNPYSALATLPNSGATPTSTLTETVTTSTGTTVGSSSVSDDLDSGGVYGTIPSSISSSTLAQGDIVKVYDGTTELYQYTVGTDSIGQSEAPTAVSGTSIDSGVMPFLTNPVYLDYAGHTISIDK